MTLLVVSLIAAGVIFIASALENCPIITTFKKIISGQAIDWTGTAGSLTATGIAPSTSGCTPTTGKTGGQQFGGSGGASFGSTPPPQTGGQQFGGSGGASFGTGSGVPQSWQQYAVTQAHGVSGETGVDIGTPFHTPLTSLAPGQVVSASYGPWGGSVFVKVQSAAGTLYYNYLHLDQIMVGVGQSISSGQLLGLSGGQLGYGSHPAQSAYSTGPHTEFGIYSTPYINPTTAYDPSQFYQFGG